MLAFAPINLSSSAVDIGTWSIGSSKTTAPLYAAANTNMVSARIGPSTSNKPVAKVRSVPVWTSESAVRFDELARSEALGKITIKDLAELEGLSTLRRLKYPRSARAILWERRQSKLTDALLTALRDYVEFHETSSHP